MKKKPLTKDETLYSLEQLIAELGASSVVDTVREAINDWFYCDLTDQQASRVDKIKKQCGI